MPVKRWESFLQSCNSHVIGSSKWALLWIQRYLDVQVANVKSLFRHCVCNSADRKLLFEEKQWGPAKVALYYPGSVQLASFCFQKNERLSHYYRPASSKFVEIKITYLQIWCRRLRETSRHQPCVLSSDIWALRNTCFTLSCRSSVHFQWCL